jgi:hypothetical protein
MPLSCGIVGLPNSGKSTLFNCLTAGGAQVAGYPFCTVDRNIGTTMVPDQRLEQVQRFAGSATAIPTSIEIVDIAGLVRGASKGEGLGNKFLGHIRDVDAILHVVRCFENPGAPHYLGDLDPVRDIDVIVTELILADLATVERKRERIFTAARSGDVTARAEMSCLDALAAALDHGMEVRLASLPEQVLAEAAELNLLTGKPVVLVANTPDPDGVDADGLGADDAAAAAAARVAELAPERDAKHVAVYARALADLAELGGDAEALAADFGISQEPLHQLVREAYAALDLITFFTANRNEARAWTLRRGSDAVAAAGKVHTDFARGFISAEVIGPETYRTTAGRAQAQRAGATRLEGRSYIVRDGDLLEFRFNV